MTARTAMDEGPPPAATLGLACRFMTEFLAADDATLDRTFAPVGLNAALVRDPATWANEIPLIEFAPEFRDAVIQAGKQIMRARIAAMPPLPEETTLNGYADTAAERGVVFPEQGADSDGAGVLDALDVAAMRFGRDLDAEPEPIPVLVDPLIVAGRLSVVCADGGAHKTNLLMATLMQLASGVPFIGDITTAVQFRAEGVVSLMLTCEDDELDLRHRRHRWIARARQLSGIGCDHAARLRESIDLVHMQSLSSSVVTLYRQSGPTRAMQSLERLCRRIDSLRVLVLDPAGSLFDGAVSDGTEFGGFTKELRGLASRLGIAVVLLHHVSKAAANEAARTGTLMDHHGALGTVMSANNARVAAVMQRMTEKMAPNWGVDPSEAKHFIGLTVPKANGLQPMHDPQWFRVVDGIPRAAHLRAATVQSKAVDKAQQDMAKRRATEGTRDRALREAVLAWAQDDYQVDDPPPFTGFVAYLAGKTGVARDPTRDWVDARLGDGALFQDADVRSSNRSLGAIRPGDLSALNQGME
ncbi:AAA family ATPase [Variovorax sp. GT1P44]|uniref:AAA family ATPase n=1 Tax=Variovorax sp. GT1P44 TaxID=3443742 RepID=UPI003F48A9BF